MSNSCTISKQPGPFLSYRSLNFFVLGLVLARVERNPCCLLSLA